MKILQRIQIRYTILGISSSNQSTPFNERIRFGSLLFGCLVLSQLLYLFLVASIFTEFMECISSGSSTIIMFVCFAAIAVRKNTLFESIDDIKKFIDSSKTLMNRIDLIRIRLYKSANKLFNTFFQDINIRNREDCFSKLVGRQNI